MSDFLDFYRGKRVMVAGGGGFLGSRIVRRLAGAAEISAPRTADGIDFRRYEDCRSYIKEAKPDIIVNCAANQGGIAYHVDKQADLFQDNLRMGTFLMEAAQKEGVGKFVNVVAGCSYPGYLEKDEMNEEDYWKGELHESVFSYGYARKMSVVYGLALQKQFGFRSIHLLMANMYGPGEHFESRQSKALAGLLRKFYEAKLNGLPEVVIWGTGRPVRDWLYVEDGAEGILRAGAVYEEVDPLNIATGVGVSIADLAAIIQRITEYEGRVVFDTDRPDGALHKTFGVAKMKAKLGWLPATPLEKGIRETLAWLAENYAQAIQH